MKTLALAALAAVSAPAASPDGPFRSLDFDAALVAAKEEEKVVFVDFFTTWCEPCKKLDVTTWKDEAVIAWLGEHTVALKLDAEVEVELASRYEVTGYPTLLFVKADGTVLDRLVGYRAADRFLEEAADSIRGRTALDRAREAVEAAPNDPMVRQALGDALVQAGQYAEALEEYLWCYDHGVEHEEAYSGVRASFLVGSLVRLSRFYPEARKELVKRRDALEESVLADDAGHWRLFELAALNEFLGEKDRTLQVFDRMLDREIRSPILSEVVVTILPQLLEARRYDAILAAVGDFESWWRRKHSLLDEVEERRGRDEAWTYLRSNVVSQACGLYQALLGATPVEQSGQLSPTEHLDAILALDASSSVYADLILNAVQAGAHEQARALEETARSSFTESRDLRRIERAARKIPEPEDASESAGT